MVSRATSDLHLDLVEGHGVRNGLMEAVREAVRSGRLAPGSRLPSSRSLAADLGLARNTVAEAYAELVAEGWLTARQGSGTRVAPRAVPGGRPADPVRPEPPGLARPAHDLRPGRPDVAAFPRAAWLRAARRTLAAAPDEAFGYGDDRGRPELRAALADHLARARGVRTTPDRIVVCAGAVHGLALLADLLRARRGGRVAVESHSLHLHRELLDRHGLAVGALPVDHAGARADLLGDEGAVLLTPAHQFPTGVALRPDRRAAAIDWARATGGVVIEDDYDGEFRYDRRPVGALQGLDPERVVYLGTASKALAPGLRLGWLVLPDGLAAEVGRLVAGEGGTRVPAVEQLVLAELLTSGAYDRHVRRRRQAYRRRRDELVATLAARVPEVAVRGLAAGLHALVELPAGDGPPGAAEAEALRSAAWHGLAVEGLGRFRHPDAAPRPDALVVGYATPSPSAWAGALEALCRTLARPAG
ncbi:PLP-dependent aminotransferase family protein [Pseudonocardia lutea]|uniref:PLP-dependent aminotransferase family protein n=1 Tax=Pseudonocardia lutea TaxID=2172015 RepID=A0ABW1I1P0_9PSEU